MKNSKDKVWLVTGASKGLGLTLVKKLLDHGYKVAGTSRTVESLIKAVGQQSKNFLPIEVDVLNEESVKAGLNKILEHFKTLDVVVNNAGYGQIGTLEELSDRETRNNFDVNVFGLLNVIRNVMPYFRSKKSGHFFNIASIGGFVGGFSGWGVYCSTKFAVAGLTEALASEVKSFGVNVTLVYPGYFRTNFLSKDSVLSPEHPISEYAEARKSQNAHLNEIDGNQPGDPEKFADALLEVSNQETPVLHLFLGQDAFDIANNKLELVSSEMKTHQHISTSTGF